MKLHRLELEGFGPFLDPQTVDFDAFADDGIFLITGRTGAGKSSVLDGVCYALFGGVPRYDGAERRLRSDHCGPDDPTRVTLEFSAEGERWRVTRSPEFERPKRRGGGTTKEPHRALLEVRAPEGWTGVAARPVDVAARLDEVLGLTQQQFLQVILLAQNRFARFLLAKNDERLALLRTLFGTKSFEQYASELDDRRKRAQERLAAEGVEVATLLDEAERLAVEIEAAPSATPDEDDRGAGAGAGAGEPERQTGVRERLSHIVRVVERADYRVDTLSRERIASDGRLDDALAAEREAAALRDRQIERLWVRDALGVLDADAPRIDGLRTEAERAGRAEALRAEIDAVEAARRARKGAEDRRATARERWLRVDGVDVHVSEQAPSTDDPADVARTADESARDRRIDEPALARLDDDPALARRDDELTARLDRGEAALAAEAEAATLREEVRRLSARDDELEREHLSLTSGRDDLPALLAELDERLEQLAGAASRHEAAVASRDDVRHRLEAATEAARLLERREQADLAALVRSDDLQRSIEAWTTLLRRRLAGAAVELAHGLVDGQPCAVCGARSHPHPASGDDEPVSDDEISAAEDRKNAAAEADRLASDAARVARDAHALAAARAGGEGVETLAARLRVAEDGVADALAQIDEHERLRGERAAAAELGDRIARRLAAVADERASVRQELALARQRLQGLDATLDAARGAFATVGESQRDLRDRRDAVRELRVALAAAEAADGALSTAVDALTDAVEASAFADVEAVAAALRPAGRRRELDTTIAEYDARVTATRQQLLELELHLVDAADEPVDLAPFVAAVAAARDDVRDAAAQHADALGAARRLRQLAERADAAHAATAALADAHAVVARLADTVSGRAPNTRRMTLETFVLAAELEEIVAVANLRLEQMSSGRYRLQHTDALAARGASSGLGLEIMDAYTGQCRPPQSLSGGETFLTSLALALGLAEVVTARAGGIRLDTLFIDEGFGSLDDDTLDLAMRTLDELRQGGRTVGVISHVAAMKDQLPAQLHVTATPRGPSIIRQGVVSVAR
ncbi:AAA family ATPase [Microbacterium testaceum]|uniref:AAA family ATPase n=1 Tax=Microbacterium testaceum TaxID=2033 RepID=UPI0022E27133|nr:SMC family ATPase [Microbacterium testaceum]